jgi:hypothetical protein
MRTKLSRDHLITNCRAWTNVCARWKGLGILDVSDVYLYLCGNSYYILLDRLAYDNGRITALKARQLPVNNTTASYRWLPYLCGLIRLFSLKSAPLKGPASTLPRPLPKFNSPNAVNAAEGSLLTAVPMRPHKAVKPAPKKPTQMGKRVSTGLRHRKGLTHQSGLP